MNSIRYKIELLSSPFQVCVRFQLVLPNMHAWKLPMNILYACMVWAQCQTPHLNCTCSINLLPQDMEKLRQDLVGVGSLWHGREHGFLWCPFHPEHDRNSSKCLYRFDHACTHACLKESWPRFTGIAAGVSAGWVSAIAAAEFSGRSSKEPVESWSKEKYHTKIKTSLLENDRLRWPWFSPFTQHGWMLQMARHTCMRVIMTLTHMYITHTQTRPHSELLHFAKACCLSHSHSSWDVQHLCQQTHQHLCQQTHHRRLRAWWSGCSPWPT